MKPVALAICQPPRGRAGSGLTGEETCVNRCLTIVSREEQRNELLLTCFATRTPSGGVRMHGGSGKCWYFAWSCPRGSDGGPAPTRTWTSNVRPAPLPINIKPAVRVGAVLHSTDNGKTGRVLRLVRGVQRGSLTQDSVRRVWESLHQSLASGTADIAISPPPVGAVFELPIPNMR